MCHPRHAVHLAGSQRALVSAQCVIRLAYWRPCRDYMNPYLPNAPYAADAAMLGLPISTPMTGNPSEGNVLLASVRRYFGMKICVTLCAACPSHPAQCAASLKSGRRGRALSLLFQALLLPRRSRTWHTLSQLMRSTRCSRRTGSYRRLPSSRRTMAGRCTGSMIYRRPSWCRFDGTPASCKHFDSGSGHRHSYSFQSQSAPATRSRRWRVTRSMTAATTGSAPPTLSSVVRETNHCADVASTACDRAAVEDRVLRASGPEREGK